MSLVIYGYIPTPPHDSWRSHEAEIAKREMDEETRKDTRRTMQKKNNASSNNPPNGTKNKMEDPKKQA